MDKEQIFTLAKYNFGVRGYEDFDDSCWLGFAQAIRAAAMEEAAIRGRIAQLENKVVDVEIRKLTTDGSSKGEQE